MTFSVAATLHLVGPRGLSSVTAPRCLESVSTTDVSRHEHSPETPLPETARQAPWETRQRPTSRPCLGSVRRFRRIRSRTAPDHLAVIQPPATPCLTARCRLRVDRLLPLRAMRLVDGSAASFFGCGRLRRLEPSDTSRGQSGQFATRWGGRAATLRERLFPDCVSPFSPVHVNATGLSELEVPSAGEDHHTSSCERVCGAVASAGRQMQSPHEFIAVSKNFD